MRGIFVCCLLLFPPLAQLWKQLQRDCSNRETEETEQAVEATTLHGMEGMAEGLRTPNNHNLDLSCALWGCGAKGRLVIGMKNNHCRA